MQALPAVDGLDIIEAPITVDHASREKLLLLLTRLYVHCIFYFELARQTIGVGCS